MLGDPKSYSLVNGRIPAGLRRSPLCPRRVLKPQQGEKEEN